MEIIIRPPIFCSPVELAGFSRLVLAGGAVDPAGFQERLATARCLVFARDQALAGVGAVKRPAGDYRQRVFTAAGCELTQAAKNGEEIGWIAVSPEWRGSGIGRLLLGALLKEIGASSCFATTRTDNGAMRRLLESNFFERTGRPFESRLGDYTLVLYQRPSLPAGGAGTAGGGGQ